MKKFSGKVERVAPVATINDVNLMMFGVLFSGEAEWLRVCTCKLEIAEKIAFLPQGAVVEIETGNVIVVSKSKYNDVSNLTIK